MYQYFKAPLLDENQSTSSKVFKAGIAILGGSCVVLLGVMTVSTLTGTLHNAGESTELFGMPNSLRSAMNPSPMTRQMMINQLPGPSPWKDLALLSIEATNARTRGQRDVSMNAMNKIQSIMAGMSSADKAIVAKAESAVMMKGSEMMAGQTAPMGFFDPVGFSKNIDKGKLVFYREAEVKHGRIGMLATLGMFVGEKFHPFFNGEFNGPSVAAFPSSNGYMQGFWIGIFICLSLPELTYLLLPTGPSGLKPDMDRIPGDLGFDPLNLKPEDPKALLEVQNKELNNGRLAMLAAAGIMAQELVTGQKVF